MAAIVNRNRQADEIGQYGRAPRPSLDRLPTVGLASLIHLGPQVVVNEWSFFY